MTVNQTPNYANTPVTIYPAKYYPIYVAHQTIGGWAINYLSDRYTMRPIDGGKIYPSRQNAYKRVHRLNNPIKYALKATGEAEAEYGSGYIVNVSEGENSVAPHDEYPDYKRGYWLTIRQGAMPPFERKFFESLDELETYAREHLPHPLIWSKVKPEAI